MTDRIFPLNLPVVCCHSIVTWVKKKSPDLGNLFLDTYVAHILCRYVPIPGTLSCLFFVRLYFRDSTFELTVPVVHILKTHHVHWVHDTEFISLESSMWCRLISGLYLLDSHNQLVFFLLYFYSSGSFPTTYQWVNN